MAQNAFVTFVMRGDSFIPGALVLGYSLQNQGTMADLVCLVTHEVSESGKFALKEVFNHVIEIDEIIIENSLSKGRSDRPYLFTRLQALRLGIDGDLGFSYEKIVLLDADIMPLSNYDDLFKLNTPAGIINISKSFFVDKSPRNGHMKWHDFFEKICPHGYAIPRELTDAVWYDDDNLGVNACLWVLKPSYDEYLSILRSLKCPIVMEKVSRYRWPEMQYMTYYWSGTWFSVDLKYASFNAQPHLKFVYGTHFAGIKPWSDKKNDSLQHYAKFEDYQLWFKTFYEMSKYVYPTLLSLPKLKRLTQTIESQYLKW